MASFNNQSQNNRSIRWSAIAAALAVQIVVLLVLAVVVAGYLEWSSDANQAEFTRATTPAVSDQTHLPQSSTQSHPVKARAGCQPKT